MHYDGFSWKDVTPKDITIYNLYRVYPLAANDVWFCGADGIWHYDGANWVHSLSGGYVKALSFATPTDGWAIAGLNGYLHWDGASWKPAPSRDEEDREDIANPAVGEAWAVGGGFPGAPEAPPWKPIYYFNKSDGGWVAWPHPREAEKKSLTSVHFAAPDDGWAAGQVVLRWDGVEWRHVPCGYFAYTVFTLGNDAVWLGCEDRRVLKYDPSWYNQTR